MVCYMLYAICMLNVELYDGPLYFIIHLSLILVNFDIVFYVLFVLKNDNSFILMIFYVMLCYVMIFVCILYIKRMSSSTEEVDRRYYRLIKSTSGFTVSDVTLLII